jgi:hypothetical protein
VNCVDATNSFDVVDIQKNICDIVAPGTDPTQFKTKDILPRWVLLDKMFQKLNNMASFTRLRCLSGPVRVAEWHETILKRV